MIVGKKTVSVTDPQFVRMQSSAADALSRAAELAIVFASREQQQLSAGPASRVAFHRPEPDPVEPVSHSSFSPR